VFEVAGYQGLAVPQQKHRNQLKEVESEAQRTKETSEASGNEMRASKLQN